MTRLGLALTLAVGAIASSFVSIPAAAKEPEWDGSTIISAIDDATLRAAIAEVGANASALDDEENTVRIAYPNGMRGVARRMACSPETDPSDGCKGLILLGYFSKPDDVPPQRAQSALARFGFEQVIASVVVNREGEHVVKSYVMLDGGITQRNLTNWIGLFGQSLAAYQTMLRGEQD